MSNTFISVKEYFKGDREHYYDYIFEGHGGEGYYCLYDPEEMSYANIKRCLSERLCIFLKENG